MDLSHEPSQDYTMFKVEIFWIVLTQKEAQTSISAWSWLHCDCSRCWSTSLCWPQPALETSTNRGPRIQLPACTDQKTKREQEAEARGGGLRSHLSETVASKGETYLVPFAQRPSLPISYLPPAPTLPPPGRSPACGLTI